MKKNKGLKNAFTLAEVLVTLGIIGVVSAMTIPTLMNNYQRQSYTTQLHKIYTETSQAFVQYTTEHNGDNLYEAGIRSQAALNTFVPQYMKVTETCANSLTPCFLPTADYKKMSGDALSATAYNVVTSYILASGASIRFLYTTNGQMLGHIMVDVNGNKGPNILGRDLFTITFYRDGTLDEVGTASPVSRATREALFTNQCNAAGGTSVFGCFGKILNDNWTMTY